MNETGPTNQPIPHDERAAERREIVRAAYRIIDRSSGKSSSVQAILDEAGLSTRAFYRHFRSKDELLTSMYRTASQRVTAELAAAAIAAEGPVQAFAAWVDLLLSVAYSPNRAVQARVLTSTEALSSSGVAGARTTTEMANTAVLIEILERGKLTGDFPQTEPVPDARAVSSVVHSLVSARLAGEGGPSWSEARDHTVRLFSRSFGASISNG